MHSNKGITLITLAITIIIMIILAGVTVNVGFNAYKNAKVSGFVSEMSIIQEQVNTAYTKIKNGDTTYLTYGSDISGLNEEVKQKIQTALEGKEDTNFRYYNGELLKQLGVDGVKQEVIINFQTREVYSLDGIEYEGKMYYTQYDLPGGQYNIGYIEQNTQQPEFTIEKKNYGLYATLNIKDIQYKGDVEGGTLYYGLVTNDSTTPVTVEYWQKIANNTVEINKSGMYAIKLVDKAENQTIKTEKITLVNSPTLADGMIPVIFDETAQKWKQINVMDGDWYDYAEKKWANMMLSDGITLDSSGYVTKMGSMFVWIPRYAYQITSNYHKNQVGNIDIKFLQETTNLATDLTNINIENTSGQNKWNVHPAFSDGSITNYINGGWKEEITGIWVAKFEASSSTPTANNGGGDNLSYNIKVLPNVASWRGISEENIFTKCLSMNQAENIYGLNSTSYPHQMKNIEWGAVSYLTQSIYGKASEPYINNSTTYITGNAAGGVSEVGVSGKVNEYQTSNGQKASSTGNIYGIYDLSGGALERVAAYANTGSGNISNNANSLTTAEKYYVDVYTSNYADCVSRYGDAIWETSSSATGTSSWNTDLSKFPSGDTPFFSRGGWSNNGGSAGLFAFYDDTTGSANSTYGFRPVIII